MYLVDCYINIMITIQGRIQSQCCKGGGGGHYLFGSITKIGRVTKGLCKLLLSGKGSHMDLSLSDGQSPPSQSPLEVLSGYRRVNPTGAHLRFLFLKFISLYLHMCCSSFSRQTTKGGGGARILHAGSSSWK